MNFQNILIVKLSAIGDVIHALPVAHALKQSFPQARITWVVEKSAYELLKDHPYIDEVILFDKFRCRTLPALVGYLPGFIRRLKAHSFDLALDLQGLFKSGIIALLSGAPKRLVYCHARELSGWMSKKICGTNQKGHIIEQYLDVVRALACPVETPNFAICFNQQESIAAQQILIDTGWNGEPYVVFVSNASRPNKSWPAYHFTQLAERLHEKDILSIIVGGSSDIELGKKICTAATIPILDITGKTSLKQLAWIIKNARVTVGGDTGPMHLAVAVHTPTVALMGPTDPIRNGPYGKEHLALITSRDCAGCWQRKCKKQLDCLEAIAVADVYQAVMRLYSDNGGHL